LYCYKKAHLTDILTTVKQFNRIQTASAHAFACINTAFLAPILLPGVLPANASVI
jgi:hypothetical protein